MLSYINAHQGRIDALRLYFIVEDNLSYHQRTRRDVAIRGRIRCEHDLFLDVKEILVLNEWRQVQLIDYRYHAGVEGLQDRPIFRYDNAHTYTREGHPDEHHRHRYDHTTWQEIKPPEWISPTVVRRLATPSRNCAIGGKRRDAIWG